MTSRSIYFVGGYSTSYVLKGKVTYCSQTCCAALVNTYIMISFINTSLICICSVDVTSAEQTTYKNYYYVHDLCLATFCWLLYLHGVRQCKGKVCLL